MRRPAMALAAATAVAFSMIVPGEASAQPAPPPVARSSEPAADGYTGPHRAMIGTGVLTLVVWYVPSAIVASNSRISGDSHLAVPVAGPWLDLADRPQCGAGNISCRTERLNQTMLVLDGLFQAWGVGAVITGLFVTERPRPPAPAAATLRISPAQVGPSAYGVAAIGTF
jgi:hypothetical protein